MTTTFVAATRAQSRVFVAEGLPGPNNPPVFQGCLVMGGASQGQGDVEYIYCPDPDNYNRFVVVGEIQGREENVETSLSGHFPLNRRSQIIKWGNAKSPLAIHVHFGTASNPQNFNVFEKAVIFDDGARITSTDIDEMGALDESAEIGQSADISAAGFYEVVPLSYVEVQESLVDSGGAGAAMARVYDDRLPIDNRQAYYVITNGDGTTLSDAKLVYSINGGSVWAGANVPTGDNTRFPSGVAVLNDVVIVPFKTGTEWYYYNAFAAAPAFVAVDAGMQMNAISSNGSVAYVVGNTGAMGRIDDYASAPETVSPGTSNDILSVHVSPSGAVICGDDAGNVMFAPDGVTFGSYEIAAGDGVTAVFAQNTDVAWAGTNDGELYYTTDGGVSWALRGFPGSGTGTGVVTDINFPTLSVGYVAFQPAGALAVLLKTVGAGAVGTWYTVPRSGALPTSYNLSISLIPNEPNILLAAGNTIEDIFTSDGIAILGLE